MDDAVHSAARTLDGFLESIHGAGDVLFEGVSYEDVILLRVPVIGTGSGNVVDPFVDVVGAGTMSRVPTRCASGDGCASSRGLLLAESFQRPGYQSCHRRGLAKEAASSVDFHEISPSAHKNVTETNNSAETSGPRRFPSLLRWARPSIDIWISWLMAGKWRVSANQGLHPLWRRDGKELYYATSGNTVWALPLKE